MQAKPTTVASISIAVGLGVLGMKALAWWLTRSTALYSDALESLVNVASSAATTAALFYASRPADANHPYGHEKAEFFAAVIIGVMIIVAALSIFSGAAMHWGSQSPLQAPVVGLAITLGATVVNGVWASVVGRAGRQRRSPALLADSRHLWSDVATSLGVVGGVALMVVTGQIWLDSAIAVLVGLHVLWSGWGVVRMSVGGLMDEAPAELMERTRSIVQAHAAGAIEAHDLRMRVAGRVTYLEFHLVVPGEMSVADAHEICDRVEAALRAGLSEMVITIHVEPEGKAKHRGVLVL